MSITATELKQNLGYYLALAATENIYITKNGKDIAVLSNPIEMKISHLNSLKGIIPNDGKTLDDYRAERLAKYL
ncbi:MAG: type II toxin-antitoxin system Phd/YefM family antitoxin [Spirochaetales bacterium]|nr:type II toxin-antitoxin system Phd/YefM family antitoxin [Spirochaetales bacterium]